VSLADSLIPIQNKLWLYEKIDPNQYLKMPYYEFMWFAKEWIEYIDAKIKRQQEEQAEWENQKKKTQSMNYKSPKIPKMPKY